MDWLDEIRARLNADPDWGVYDGALCRKDLEEICDEISSIRADLARVTAERDAAVARWVETASDNTNYTLTHSGDGMYAVADRDGHVVCEFLRISCAENGGTP